MAKSVRRRIVDKVDARSGYGRGLTSRLQSFETGVLTQEDNLAGLAALNRELIAKAEAIDSPRRVVLDMDSTEIPVYGEQEQSSYNGHFESTCYHPPLLFNREGDCLAAKLRPGNVHSEHYGVADAASVTAEPQAGVSIQKFSLSGGELDDSPAGGGEGRVPLRGVVPPRPLYRDQLGARQPAVVRFYNKRGTAEQWIKGKQAGGRADAA
jgi:DDE family transposase